jgi:hypothetical protein
MDLTSASWEINSSDTRMYGIAKANKWVTKEGYSSAKRYAMQQPLL